MKKIAVLFLIILVTIMKVAFAQPCKEVIGYYPNWQWYDRGNLVAPKTIDYSKFLIIHFLNQI